MKRVTWKNLDVIIRVNLLLVEWLIPPQKIDVRERFLPQKWVPNWVEFQRGWRAKTGHVWKSSTLVFQSNLLRFGGLDGMFLGSSHSSKNKVFGSLGQCISGILKSQVLSAKQLGNEGWKKWRSAFPIHPECRLKKPFSSCKLQAEKIRFYQVSSHESFQVAVSDLSKQHGAAVGRAKALAEARTQFQAEKRKAEAQCARFAKRQAAMLEYESCLANSPYKPQRGSAGTAGEASRGGSSEASASARPPQQFREGMNCPDCLTGVLSAKHPTHLMKYLWVQGILVSQNDSNHISQMWVFLGGWWHTWNHGWTVLESIFPLVPNTLEVKD